MELQTDIWVGSVSSIKRKSLEAKNDLATTATTKPRALNCKLEKDWERKKRDS